MLLFRIALAHLAQVVYNFAKPLFGLAFHYSYQWGKQQVRRRLFTDSPLQRRWNEDQVSAHAYTYLRATVLLRNTYRVQSARPSTMGSKLSVSSLFLLLLFLVEVHSQQTFPYVSFSLTGPALANHSYVDLSTVGSASDNSDSVVCHTDLITCCSAGQGIHRGNWSFPDGTVLPFIGPGVTIGQGSAAQRAVIRRTGGATGPTGIYHCRIATVAVHSDDDISVRDSAYVGLYPADGGNRLATVSISP